ncbi:cytochrome c biogenesis protein CcdA [Candidatus Kaiserbacteria bacterium]|nr:cytochrome c biogenesis protein CcdA [Candidatus Kaiserbacteria bacterium]
MLDVPLLVGAFVAGMLMFLAPCTLPIVPGYLAFIAGIPLSALSNPAAKKSARRAVLRNALAFVIGFSVIFITLGASAGLVGFVAGPWRYALAKFGGVMIILFGLTMLGFVPAPFLSRERHLRLPRFLVMGHLSSSALIGALFALGWSPCIGPILGTVLLIASSSSTALYGALLLAVFSLGLGVPFLLCALLVNETTQFLSKLDGFVRVLTLVGGIGLIVTGVLMVSGLMDSFIADGYAFFHQWGYDALLDYL